ncbi:MAG TPA: acyclic terpene utilization AtuA family protein [Xanthobacteraceae bacterium]|nr:acyclic terpene utilization AtuA family protein [Xanthobacteraceae bacterium]
MTKTVRIGCGAGFQGDRLEPAVVLASQGELDYLMLECLGERTVALAQLRRLHDPTHGYDALLERRMRDLLPLIKQNGVRVVSNMGAANPIAGAEAIIALARTLSLKVRVAALTGDDVLEALDPRQTVLETGEPLESVGALFSANAYLGVEEMLPALATGADVVLTGRVADPSLALAPLAHEFGWKLDDADRFARGTMVGHLLECAGQLTGGYYADPGKKDVPDMAHLGFPFADVDAEGHARLSKVAGTGGRINRMTATEQLLYEVTDPSAYLTPDVTADFSAVEIRETGPDTIAVAGARGRKRPDTLKVSVGYQAGYIGEGEISYGGENCVARARLAGEIVAERLRGELQELRIDIIGVSALHTRALAREAPSPYEVRLRVAGRSADRARAARIGEEVEALWTNGPAGGGGARKETREQIGIVSCLLPREKVQPQVTVLET